MFQAVTQVATTSLKIHPRNSEFYDDIIGQDYNQFRDSIVTEGILSPLIVSFDMTIISGHQRYRAAKELGLETVPIIIREDLRDPNDVLRTLIAANFGRLKNDPAKQRKAIVEYVELVGYKHGEIGKNHMRDSQKGQIGPSENPKMTLSQIAEELGISERDLKRTLRIEKSLTEEMKALLDTDVIGKTIAADCITSMSPEEQEELISQLDVTRKYTAKQLQPYIDEIRTLKSDRDAKATAAKNLETKNAELQQKLNSTAKSHAEIKLEQQTNNLRSQLTTTESEIDRQQQEIEDLRAKLTLAQKPQPEYKAPNSYSAIATDSRELATLMYKIQEMLDTDLSPLKFSRLLDRLDESETVKQNLSAILSKVDAWSNEMHKMLRTADVDIVDVIDC